MTVKDIEAREKAATPLTDKEYAEWKGNIEALAEAHEGPWYRMEGGKLVPVQARPDGGAGMTTTIGIQLRLFATIDYLLDLLRDREEKLAAMRVWGKRNRYQDAWPDLRDWPGFDRILQGGE